MSLNVTSNNWQLYLSHLPTLLKQLLTYLLLIIMAVYAAPLVLPTSDDPVIAMIEGEKKDQSKTKEQKELEEEVLFIQQIYEGASAAACSLYTDSHPLFPFPGRRYHTTPPNFC